MSSAIDDFLRSPGSLQSSQSLIASFKGVDFSLPTVPASAVVPGVPVITGITAAKSAYGDVTNVTSQRIARERAKEAAALTGNSLKLGNQLLDVADQLEAQGGDALARDLMLDAASLRYAESGLLKNPQITVVQPDGTLATVPLNPDIGFPSNALIQRARTFSSVDGAYPNEAGAVRRVLTGGASNAKERGAVLDTADHAEQVARQSFFSADILTGERRRRFAMGMADIATRFRR